MCKRNYYKHAFKKCNQNIRTTQKIVNEIISIKDKSQQNGKLLEDSECL